MEIQFTITIEDALIEELQKNPDNEFILNMIEQQANAQLDDRQLEDQLLDACMSAKTEYPYKEHPIKQIPSMQIKFIIVQIETIRTTHEGKTRTDIIQTYMDKEGEDSPDILAAHTHDTWQSAVDECYRFQNCINEGETIRYFPYPVLTD